MLAVSHGDVVEVVLADSQDVPDPWFYLHGNVQFRIWPDRRMENVKVDRDDLPVPHKVVIPARFAVLERLLHLAVAIFNQVHVWTSPSLSLSFPPRGSAPTYSLFQFLNLPANKWWIPGRSSSLILLHTPLPPLPRAETRKTHNFRAASTAGFPLCVAVWTSLWITLIGVQMGKDLTYRSDGGALSTFSQLGNVMLLKCNVM